MKRTGFRLSGVGRFACILLIGLSFADGLQPLRAQQPLNPPDAAVPHIRPLPPLRQQAEERQAWLHKRLTDVLPALMQAYGVEMWILSMREYNEDPVFWSMTAPTTFAARRRSIYIFHHKADGSVDRLALGGTSQGGLYTRYEDPDQSVPGRELWGEAQLQLLGRLVANADPRNIVLNIDEVQAFADGLSSGEREAIERGLGESYVERIRREPRLAVDYIAVRVPEMMPRYQQIMETVHAIISEAFSNKVITPGKTTTEDVVWWMRQRVNDLGMTVWFQPSVDVQRQGERPEEGAVVIQRGDVLWCDFGVVAMGLKTDTQHLGYVLHEGETEVPNGLKQGLATTNRLQDILLAEMIPGRTGNEVLTASLERMRAEGIDGTIYTHPIGDHGHGAGPLIGLWDRQEAIEGRGDVVLRPNTWFSIELQSRSAVPEWSGHEASFRQEEEAFLDEAGDRHWVYRRQETFHIVY